MICVKCVLLIICHARRVKLAKAPRNFSVLFVAPANKGNLQQVINVIVHPFGRGDGNDLLVLVHGMTVGCSDRIGLGDCSTVATAPSCAPGHLVKYPSEDVGFRLYW